MNTQKVRQLIIKLDKFYQAAQTGIATWNTLILPILIAVFVTHLFNVYTSTGEVGWTVWVMVLIVLVIHGMVMILQFKSSHMNTMLVDYQDQSVKFQEVKEEFDELNASYTVDINYFTSQSKALKVTSEALSFAIGRIRNIEKEQGALEDEHIEQMVHSLIWPLVVLREKLFAFESGALWNIALYTHRPDGNLAPIWRMHDKRIEVKNRVWRPGFGVVGLSFLHKTIKYYENIGNSTDTIRTSLKDEETYKSIIAIPVIPCEDGSSKENHSPVGVLIITSSEENQFNLDRDAQFLQTHANLMAILIEKIRTHVEHQQVDVPNQ